MIGLRRGHNFKAIGARGYVKEEEIAEKIKNDVISIFEKHNYKYVDCSPDDMTSAQDLKFGVSKCNANKCDLFFSIHLNANKTTDAPMGVEVWTYKEKFKQANDVLSNLVNLGFKNRGIKHSTKLYELKHTNCKAMIIEVCFCDSHADTELLKSVGTYKIAKAIAYGVMGIEEDVIKPIEQVGAKYRLCVGSYSQYQNAVNAKKELEKIGIDCFIIKKEE